MRFWKKINFDADLQNKIETSTQKDKLLKEKIAIDIGKMIMVTMIKDDNCPKNNPLIKFLTKNGNAFRYPKVEKSDKKKYKKNWKIELYHANDKNKLFVPSLAHELFYLEKYNRMLAEPKK